MHYILGLRIVLCLIFLLVSFSDSFALSKVGPHAFSKSFVSNSNLNTSGESTSGNFLENILGLDPDWRPLGVSPFIEKGNGIELSVNIGVAQSIRFPKTLNAKTPIVIHTGGKTIKQHLVSKDTYKAELAGKYLVYRGKKNSILYRYDADKKSLREYVYLEQSSDLPKNGEVVQWRFEGADLDLRKDGSISLTRTEDIKAEVRKISTNAMADRISRFLAKRRGTPLKEGPVIQTLFVIPPPEYIDGNKKNHKAGAQYTVENRKITLHLQPKSAPVFPLWIDPSLSADADANIVLNGQGEFDRFGHSVSSAGDFNGDGVDDVIVGIDDLFDSGSAYIFFGGQTGTINDPDTSADVVLNRQVTNDSFGRAVASAGDFNGDGKDDVIVGASTGNWSTCTFCFSGPGVAYIYFGGRTGTINDPDTNADVVLKGLSSINSGFGTAVASAGDFNGDGKGDVIVGSPGDNNNGPFGPNVSGSAFIFFGGATPVSPRNADSADVALRAQGAFVHFGLRVSSAGDFNGDGKGDVIVGLPERDNNGLFNSGSVLIYLGGLTGTLNSAETNADVELNGHEAGDFFGISVASAGDFNGDGKDDVIVGARNGGVKTQVCSFGCSLVGTGSAYIFFGGLTGTINNPDTNADVVLNGQAAGANFGISVASAGDFSGDGLDDVIVGANREHNNSVFFSGGAYIFFGGRTGTIDNPDTNADVVLNGQAAGDNFGISVASAGDFDGGGMDDVIVGANFDDNNGLSESGSAFIFFGEGSTSDTTPPVITVSDVTVEATGPLTPVTLTATALDDTDGVIIPTPNPTGPFAVGVHMINWSATDNASNTGTATQTVTVQDTTPPAVTSPADVTAGVTRTFTVVDLGTATAVDAVDGPIVPTNYAPVDGFPLGTTLVTYSATDSAGNTGTATQTVTIVDAKIGPGTDIGTGTVVGDGSKIDANVTVGDNSVVGDGSKIGEGATIGDGTTLGSDVKIESGATIGNDVIIGDGVKITEGTIIPDGTVIPDGAVI